VAYPLRGYKSQTATRHIPNLDLQSEHSLHPVLPLCDPDSIFAGLREIRIENEAARTTILIAGRVDDDAPSNQPRCHRCYGHAHMLPSARA